MRYMRADIERTAAQLELDVEIDSFLIGQVGALIIAALQNLLHSGAHDNRIERTCEHILRLLGLTPSQARREVARAQDHVLSLQPPEPTS